MAGQEDESTLTVIVAILANFGIALLTLDDPDEYIHVQEWADDAAFTAHQRSPAFRYDWM